MDEFVDALDEYGKPTGEVISKYYAHENKIYHGEICAVVINSKKELLLQKRAAGKKIHAGRWTFGVAGHVATGETFEQAARRELAEEIGLQVSIEQLLKLFNTPWVEDYQKAWAQFYLVITDKKEKDFTLQSDEVECVKWFELKKGIKLLEEQWNNHPLYSRERIFERVYRYIQELKI